MQFFGPVAARLVEHAGVRPGQHVLDVGCGRGAVLFAAAALVGSKGGRGGGPPGKEGQAVGIDLSSEMVRETAEDVRARGLANVSVEVTDGEHPSFPPASFDAVLGTSGEEWVRWSWTTGMRMVWEMVPEEDRRGLEAQVAREIDSGRAADGTISMAMPVRFVRGGMSRLALSSATGGSPARPA